MYELHLQGLSCQLGLGQKKSAKIYGVSWNKSATSALTRTDDSIGLVANAGIGAQSVINDFDAEQIFKDITTVVDLYGNSFVRIPKFYIKKTDIPGYKSWQISRRPFAGAYLPWAFWDFTNSKELPYIDIGKHRAGIDGSNRMTSKSGEYPAHSRNIVQFRDNARLNGIGYQQMDVHVSDIIRTMFYVEYATLNSQGIMQGYTSGQYTNTHLAVISETAVNRIVLTNANADQYRVGQAISVGTSQGGNQVFYGRTITAISVYDGTRKAITFDGAPVNISVGNMLYNTGYKTGFSSGIVASSGSIVANDSKYPCSYRGIEEPWGGMWCFVDGININNYQAWICNDQVSYTSNVFAAPYQQLGYVNANTNNWAQEMGFDSNCPFAEFPTVVGASSSYYSDYYYQNTGQRIALLGGAWNSGSGAGVSYWFLNSSSTDTYVDFGARLVRKPL